MKKRFGLYTAVWAALLVLFNVIAFVSAGWEGQEKYTTAFWTGYAFITVTFLGQLICAYFALKETNAQKLFYRISLLKTSYSGLTTTFFFGGLCMLISPLPYWIGILVCSIILAANVIAVVKTVGAIDEVVRIDSKVKQQTIFIKSLTVDAEGLMARAKSDAVRAECKKLYEAARYSDPISSDMIASIEGQITVKFAVLSDAVSADDVQAVSTAAAEILILIKERNAKCKLLKNG
ncbi:MAG: hypothetical protein E7453_03265 [Ruminococcaceae bacterium]|nr:hypothetical protein [Oscillospiraceae bacterium]